MVSADMARKTALLTLTAIIVAQLIGPIIGVYIGWMQSEGDGAIETLMAAWSSQRTLTLLTKSLWVALQTSILCTGIGLYVAICSESVSARHRTALILACLGGGLVSPYIATQAYLSLFANESWLASLLGIESMPNLNTQSGLVAMLTVSLLPWSIALIAFGARPVSKEARETLQLSKASFREWLALDYIPRYGIASALSIAIVFVLAFWAYEIPSMLRQNLISIELLAAFGSFYDYRAGIGLAFAPLALGLLIALFIFKSRGASMAVSKRLGESTPEFKRRLGFYGASCLYLLIALGIPLVGLVGEIGSWGNLMEQYSFFSSEVFNTILIGSLSSTLCGSLGVLVAGGLRMSGWDRLSHLLVALSIGCICLPGVVYGMGFSYIYNTDWFPAGIKGWLPGTTAAMPFAFIGFWAVWRSYPDRWIEEARIRGIGAGEHLFSIVIPWIGARLFLIMGFAFVWSIREVPATLLNHPPGGATLAVSIETLLHFEQPEKVAVLCLLQLFVSCLGILVFVVVAKGIRRLLVNG